MFMIKTKQRNKIVTIQRNNVFISPTTSLISLSILDKTYTILFLILLCKKRDYELFWKNLIDNILQDLSENLSSPSIYV